jgi:hypothetical protein
MEAPLRTVTFSVFVLENSGFPSLAAESVRLSTVISAGADCLVFTAVKPVGGDSEAARTPLVLGGVPFSTSDKGTGLAERAWPGLPSSASRRLIMAAFRFFSR